MSNRINISQLGKVVGDLLEEYEDLVEDDVEKVVKKVGKETVKELRETSPRKTGDYAKGWKAKVTGKSSHGMQVTIHNETDYQLTHLLEKGHAKRGGGRVRSIPHIAPAQEKADAMLEEEIEKKLKGK